MLIVMIAISSQGNIPHLSNKQSIMLSVEIYIFSLRKIDFSRPVDVIDLSNVDGVFHCNLLFEIAWNVNILFKSLFSLRISILVVAAAAAGINQVMWLLLFVTVISL